MLKQYGIDIEGYRNEINSSFVNHVLNRHSNEKTEEAREQKAISEKDLYSLNDVVQSPDFIVVEDARNINTALVFVKNMPDGSTILVENVGNKKKRLLAKTMRIKRRAISGDELSTLYPTSETLPSVNIIIDTSDIKSNTETEGHFVDDEGQGALFDMPAGQYAATADATISKDDILFVSLPKNVFSSPLFLLNVGNSCFVIQERHISSKPINGNPILHFGL